MHRVEQTADKLIGAFFKGQLVHGEPCACAVGTLCNANPFWINAINGYRGTVSHDLQKLIPEHVPYNLEEILEIERKFEGRLEDEGAYKQGLFKGHEQMNAYAQQNPNCTTDPDSFKGLTAVFDLLCNDIDRDYFETEESRVNIFAIRELGIEEGVV